MWHLLFSSLCMGYIVWAQTSGQCTPKPSSCKNVRYINVTLVKTVLNNGAEVLCDTQTDNGGWTIIQRRHNFEQSFNLSWSDYVDGFGSLDGDFWIGLRLMNEFTYKRCYALRIEFVMGWIPFYAQYSFFKVYGEEDNYTLRIGTFSGNASDSLREHDGQQFSTKDRDNDQHDSRNCALMYSGGWWFHDCYDGFLNAVYRSHHLDWDTPFHISYSGIRFTEMKIRPCVTALV